MSETSAFGFGGRLTAWVGTRVALDLSIGRWDAAGTVSSGGLPCVVPFPGDSVCGGIGSPSGTADMTSGSLGVLFSFTPPGGVGLFVLGGLSFVALGGSTYHSSSPVAPSQTDWGPVLGVGVRVPFSPTLGLRLEVEDYLYRLTDVGGAGSSSAGQHALVFSVGPSVTINP